MAFEKGAITHSHLQIVTVKIPGSLGKRNQCQSVPRADNLVVRRGGTRDCLLVSTRLLRRSRWVATSCSGRSNLVASSWSGKARWRMFFPQNDHLLISHMRPQRAHRLVDPGISFLALLWTTDNIYLLLLRSRHPGCYRTPGFISQFLCMNPRVLSTMLRYALMPVIKYA